MTTRMSRVFTCALALMLIGGALGCGFINSAKNFVDTAGVLSNFADRLGKAAALTFTAEYKVSGQDEKGKAKEEPTVKLVLGALLIDATCWTLSVKLWLTGPPIPLVAVNVSA